MRGNKVLKATENNKKSKGKVEKRKSLSIKVITLININK